MYDSLVTAGQASQNSGGQLRIVASSALHQLQVCSRGAPSPVQQLRIGESHTLTCNCRDQHTSVGFVCQVFVPLSSCLVALVCGADHMDCLLVQYKSRGWG